MISSTSATAPVAGRALRRGSDRNDARCCRRPEPRRASGCRTATWYVVCGMTTKSSCPRSNRRRRALARGRRRRCTRPRRCAPSCRSDRCPTVREQRLIRGLAEDDHACAGAGPRASVKKRPADSLRKLMSANCSVAPRTPSVLRAVAAVEHALRRRCRRPAPSQMSTMPTDGASFSMARGIVHGEVRPPHQLGEVGARREADAAELRDEDRVRPELANAVAQRLVEAADERGHADDRR